MIHHDVERRSPSLHLNPCLGVRAQEVGDKQHDVVSGGLVRGVPVLADGGGESIGMFEHRRLGQGGGKNILAAPLAEVTQFQCLVDRYDMVCSWRWSVRLLDLPDFVISHFSHPSCSLSNFLRAPSVV